MLCHPGGTCRGLTWPFGMSLRLQRVPLFGQRLRMAQSAQAMFEFTCGRGIPAGSAANVAGERVEVSHGEKGRCRSANTELGHLDSAVGAEEFGDLILGNAESTVVAGGDEIQLPGTDTGLIPIAEPHEIAIPHAVSGVGVPWMKPTPRRESRR